MSFEPLLLIPAFRYGKETPWGGELLNRLYGKFAVGSKIGESCDFCFEAELETTLPGGATLSEFFRGCASSPLGEKYAVPPFALKWIDCSDTQRVHSHPDKNEYLYVIKAYNTSRIDIPDKNGDWGAHPLRDGDILCIPKNVPHAISGTLFIQITSKDFTTIRTDISKDVFLCNHKIEDIRLQPSSVNAHFSHLIETSNFSVYEITDCTDLRFASSDSFMLLTCLSEAVIKTERTYYLSAGQSVLIPAGCVDFTLNGSRFLLTMPA